jgi:cellulose 1,4-beta-cellobiosidase
MHRSSPLTRPVRRTARGLARWAAWPPASLLRWFMAAAWLVACMALASAAHAQARVANPFAGATWYVNPDYAAQVDTAIAQEPDAALAQRMQTVKTYPTAVWMDRIAAIAGGNGRRSLAAHLDTALAQQQGSTPIVVKLVIYDLPGRDCAALASNGELSIAANPPSQPLSGLDTYKAQYIDPIVQVLSNPAYANIRIVAIIEPDSLPNLVVNTGIAACAQALQSGAYVQGIQYAITRLHELPNVYQYLDIGHSGWLGWASNMNPAVQLYSQVVAGTPAGFDTIDGFVTNVANTLPTREPHMDSGMTVGGQQLISASFYEFNPHIDEASYAQALYQNFVTAGFPPRIGLVIDTSRNGWGGAARPSGPSTSTVLNTFVNATKIDRRAHRGLWCNPVGAGIGAPPQASPAGFFAQLQAFVWIKPPGESDGTYLASQSPRPDPNCDPANSNPLAGNTPTGAYPNSPPAGSFFLTQFRDLVNNAFPAIPTSTSTSPGLAVAANPAALTVNRGASATSNLTLTRSNGFSGAVTFTASGLPAGVTASFSPATTSATGTSSVVAFSASSTAALGAAAVTITASGGGLIQAVTLALTVAAGGGTPDFSVSASPAVLSVAAGSSTSGNVTLTRSNGFAGAVSFSATGLPAGVTASFSPATTSTTGTGSVLTLSAAGTAAAGTATVTIAASSGAASRTATVVLTVSSTGGGTGGVTVTPVIASASNYFNDQQVRVASTGPVSALSVTIVVQRTTGIGFGGQYNTVGGSIAQASSSTTATITYTYALGAGQTLNAGTYTFAAQTSGSGTAHPMAGDSFTVTYTAGGQTFTRTGSF